MDDSFKDIDVDNILNSRYYVVWNILLIILHCNLILVTMKRMKTTCKDVTEEHDAKQIRKYILKMDTRTLNVKMCKISDNTTTIN